MTKFGGPRGRKPTTIGARAGAFGPSYRGIHLDDELFGPTAGPASARRHGTEPARSDRPNLPAPQVNLRGQPAPSKDRNLDTEASRLRELVAVVARQSVAAQEKIKAEYGAEIMARRRDVAELQKQLQQSDADLRQARDENRHRIQESAAVQAAFDTAHRELMQAARRLIETDKTLGVTQSRLKETEAALDEANRTHIEEIATLNSRLEDLQARSNETESLLEEARQTLAARDDEFDAIERRLAEATTARDGNAEKLVELTATLAERETQIADFEQSHLALREENALLAEVNAARGHGEDVQQKIKEQDDLIRLLEQQIQSMRSAGETQLQQLAAQLQRERNERTMAEAAIESGRKDVARLLQEIGVLRQRLNLPPPGPAARAA